MQMFTNDILVCPTCGHTCGQACYLNGSGLAEAQNYIAAQNFMQEDQVRASVNMREMHAKAGVLSDS